MKLDEILRDKRVAIYGRHSTDKQEMDAQIASAEKLVQAYNCSVVGRYFDRGVSATKKPHHKRGELVRLMRDVVEKQFDVVITYNRDRLARNPIEHQTIRVLMKEFGIPIVLSSTETLYDTGDLVSQLAFDGLTKFEVDQTRIRTRDTLRNFVRNGRWTGGKAPYGYQYDDKTGKFILNPKRADIVTKIFDMYRHGEGFKSIAQSLTNSKVDNRQWANYEIKSIVTNPFYAGYVTFGKGINKSHNSIAARETWLMTKCKDIPPIITEEVWEASWKLYWDKRQGTTSPTALKTPFLLKDLLFCADCERALEATNQIHRKRYGGRWYRCPQFGKVCCTRVDVENIHSRVFGTLHGILSKTDVFGEVSLRLRLEEQELQQRITSLKKSIEENEREGFEALATMKRLFREDRKDEDRQVVLAQVQKYRLELDERSRTLQAEIDTCEAQLRHVQTVQMQPNLWEQIRLDLTSPDDEVTLNAKRRLALYMLDGVWIKGETITNYRAKVNLDE